MARMFGLFLRDIFSEGRCLAIKKNGIPCKIRGAVFLCKNGKLRCKFHGGKSTGARTVEGKEKANRVRREGWERHRERIMKALQDGHRKWRARQRAEKRALAERERKRQERVRLYTQQILERINPASAPSLTVSIRRQ